MKPLARPDIRIVLGRGGRGKSTLVRSMLRRERRVLVFDPKAEPEYAQGAVVATTMDQLLAELVGAGAGPLRVVFRGVAAYDYAAFEHFNRAAWAFENATIVWEEVDNFVTAQKMPPAAFRIVNEGRHRRLRVIGVARRPARVSRDLTANASDIMVFQTSEPRDLRYLADVIGEAANGLPGIPDWHYLHWSDAGATVKKSPKP